MTSRNDMKYNNENHPKSSQQSAELPSSNTLRNSQCDGSASTSSTPDSNGKYPESDNRLVNS